MANRRRDLEKEQFWRLVLDEQRKGGLSVRAFCRRESISEPSFYAWRRELKRRDAKESQPAQQPANRARTLVPVEVVDPPEIRSHGDPPAATRNVEIVTPEGWLLRLASSIDPAQLRTLLDGIAGRQSATPTEAITPREPTAC